MHENLRKNVNENMFSFTFLCKFLWVFMKGIWYSFTLLISYMVLNPFKMAVLDCIKFPNFDGSNDIFPNSTGP